MPRRFQLGDVYLFENIGAVPSAHSSWSPVSRGHHGVYAADLDGDGEADRLYPTVVSLVSV